MSNEREPAPDDPPLWASWGMSLLNGLVGDYLHDRQNGLAIDMAFYRPSEKESVRA
jgi:hypothetical protein